MMEVFHERPQDTANRLPQEMAVYDLLDELQIHYDRVDHAAAMTMEDCREAEQVLGTSMCKNLFLCDRHQTQFYLLMMPGSKKFVTRDLCREIQAPRLSFAGEEHMAEFLHIYPGAVSIMGLMNDAENHVQLLMDREVAESDFLGCHPCVNTASIKLRTAEVLEKFLPAVHHVCRVVDL